MPRGWERGEVGGCVGAGPATSTRTEEGTQEQNVGKSGHQVVLLLAEGLEPERDQQEEQEHQQRHQEP